MNASSTCPACGGVMVWLLLPCGSDPENGHWYCRDTGEWVFGVPRPTLTPPSAVAVPLSLPEPAAHE